ncbi:MAG TPA: ABC transporter substrate-binding protein [Vicinamibacterales bacterium]|nr:ABC transporter substrate-binding protein [Vicinamibacterales bacterium]
MQRLAGLVILMFAGACAAEPSRQSLTFTASGLGAEADVVRAQLARFAEQHPGIDVELRVTPDAADQRHQLYVQWLNAQAQDPDVLQLDIIWTAEFAGAGWILPLDRYGPDARDFFPAAIESNRWRGALYALPWFVDVGLLYWRTDLMSAPPQSLAALRDAALGAIEAGETRWGLAWQGARYEGLVTVFVEHLGAFGGGILDDAGAVIVDQPAAVRALTFMCDSIENGLVPASSLTWQEEQVRFAFQNGQTAFMRNWPYAWALLRDPAQSRVAGRVSVAPFPGAEGGRATAALGGAQLAVNAFSDQPELAWELVEFLTAPDQMLERARVAAQLPSRQSLYDSPELARALNMPLENVRAAVAAAVPRPVTPVYSELSELLQVHLHRALTGQQNPEDALNRAAADIRHLLARSGLDAEAGH